MKDRFAQLHRTVVAALDEADALHALSASKVEPIVMSDVGIGLDKARAALERLVWPDCSDDHSFLQ